MKTGLEGPFFYDARSNSLFVEDPDFLKDDTGIE